MKRFAAIPFLFAVSLHAQTQIQTTINPNQAVNVVRIAVPRPETTLPLETIETPFFAPLTRDLASSGIFALAPIPPNIPPIDPNALRAIAPAAAPAGCIAATEPAIPAKLPNPDMMPLPMPEP